MEALRPGFKSLLFHLAYLGQVTSLCLSLLYQVGQQQNLNSWWLWGLHGTILLRLHTQHKRAINGAH